MRRRQRISLPPVHAPVEPRAIVRARARGRAKVVGALLVTMLAAVSVRGALLCADPDEEVVQWGSTQRYDEVELRGRRGDILDRQGRSLATSVEIPSVIVDPGLLRDESWDEVQSLAEDVAEILGVSTDYVADRMRRPDSRYAKLAARVHPDVARRIDALDSPALFLEKEHRRFYTEQGLGAQVLGFVDGAGQGRQGLEAQLNGWLEGGSVVVQRRRDRHGLDVDRPAALDHRATQGMTVHTTIDRDIQRIADRALEEVMLTFEPASATAVVVDVRTGDILALSNAPTFNPNHLDSDPAPRRNHAIQDAIEPGSVFKPFVAAAALEEGLITETTPVDCEGGYWRVGRSRIRDDHPHRVVTATEVVKYSSNIGAAKLAFQLGPETYLDYLESFGFNQRTGVPLPGERRGFLRDPEHIKPIELATTAFGQGATSTPLQLTMAVATIGNGGLRMKPRLVTRIEDEHGVPEFIQDPEPVRRVLSEETAAAVTRMMVTVTEPGGTATRAQVPGFKVAGKTGTAQKAENGGYGNKRIGSFTGFVPADDPVLAITVVVDEPTKVSRYGGIVAAPAFSKIAAASLRELGVEPDPELLKPEKDEPAQPLLVQEPSQPIRLVWAEDQATAGWSMPDLSGRPMREVLASLQGSGLRVQVQGGGEAVSQEPAPGAVVPPGSTVAVTFQ